MNDVIRTLTERGSCRKFLPRPVERELVEQVVQAGLSAPSGMNRQILRLVVVQEPGLLGQLSSMNAAVGQMPGDPFYGAPMVILVLAKREGTYIYDGALAMGNMLNAAYALGLGACWIHRAKEMFQSPQGQALLAQWGLTEELEGIGCCILGYPDQPLTSKERVEGRVLYR